MAQELPLAEAVSHGSERLTMKGRNGFLVALLFIGLAAALIPVRRHNSIDSAASRLFSVVGQDFMSPLITSPRALQTLNTQLASFARFAGYDQLAAVVSAGPAPHLAKVTRFCGGLLSMLEAQYVADGRRAVSGPRVFVSEEYSRRIFGSPAKALGRAMQLGGESYRVGAVVRVSPNALGETDVWVPICSRGPYGSMTALRVLGALAQGQNWSDGEKRIASLMGGDILRDQVAEPDIARLLPLDRKVVFYPASVDSTPDLLARIVARKAKRAA
jgi:hypothetical protein